MARESKIEWTDATFNPWIGCTRVSPACDHCYAAVATPSRTLGVEWGAGKPRHRTAPSNWAQPRRWNSRPFEECSDCGYRCEAHPTHNFCPNCNGEDMKPARRRVFCASLADVFDNAVDPQWRADLFALIEGTPNLDWLLLTKRIGNVATMAPVSWIGGPVQHGPDPTNIHGGWPANVWIGATVCNQAEADRDVPKLLSVPAPVRFLSVEPMLGPIDFYHVSAGIPPDGHPWRGTPILHGIDWIICGGESGEGARPMHPAWVRLLRDQCAHASVPFLFKQWGNWRPPLEGEEFSTANGRAQRIPAFIVSPAGTVHCFESEWTRGGEAMLEVGKSAAGRTLDGATHTEYPWSAK